MERNTRRNLKRLAALTLLLAIVAGWAAGDHNAARPMVARTHEEN